MPRSGKMCTTRETTTNQLLKEFFTSPVPIPCHGDVPPTNLAKGDLYWEVAGDWEYPWRILSVSPLQGYPCGEPRKKTG